MDNLRLILAVLGVVVVACVWAFESWRRRRNAAQRDDPFAGLDGDDFSIDELPPWDEQDGVVSPAARPRREEAPAARPPARAPKPRDLFDDDDRDDDARDEHVEPPLGDLPSIKASRDDDAPLAAALSGIVVDDEDATVERPAVRRTTERHPAAAARRGERSTRAAVPDEERDGPDDAGSGRPSAPESADTDADDVDDVAAADTDPDTGTDDDDREEPPPRQPAAPPRVLSLTVMARPGRRFVGHQIRAALESVGMRYGEMQIFHYHRDDDDGAPPLFSAVNVLKPGTFDLARLGELSTTGVALFMQADGDDDDLEVFELMVDSARHLAERLGGELGDAARQPLSAARLAELRESIGGPASS